MRLHAQHNPGTLSFRGAIFDLDGVVTSTARLHFLAWKKMFENDAKVGMFTRDDYVRYVDGKPRLDGVKDFLFAKGRGVDEEELDRLANIKQRYFLELVRARGVVVFEDAVAFINKLRQHGVRVAVVSSSKNTPLVLRRAKITALFDVIIALDTVIRRGHKTRKAIRGKPAPDIFLLASQELGLASHEVIGFEDAVSGIEALKAAHIASVGINRGGNKRLQTAGADVVVRDFHKFTPEVLSEFFRKRKLLNV